MSIEIIIRKIGDELPTYILTNSHAIVSREAYALAQKILDEAVSKIKGFIHDHSHSEMCHSCAILHRIVNEIEGTPL